MTVEFDIFVVATKDRPIKILDADGYLLDSIQDADVFMSYEAAKAEIAKCDEPELYEVLRGTVSFKYI